MERKKKNLIGVIVALIIVLAFSIYFAVKINKSDEQPKFGPKNEVSFSIYHHAPFDLLQSALSQLQVSFSNLNSRTPLIMAIDAGNSLTVAKLIEAGVNVNFHGQAEAPALFHAIASTKPNAKIVHLLIEAGADVNALFGTTSKISPLLLAASNDNPELNAEYQKIIDLLLLAGADPNLNLNSFPMAQPVGAIAGAIAFPPPPSAALIGGFGSPINNMVTFNWQEQEKEAMLAAEQAHLEFLAAQEEASKMTPAEVKAGPAKNTERKKPANKANAKKR